MIEAEPLYRTKDVGYFDWTRYEIIDLVEGTDNRVLEVGCGNGNTSFALKKCGKAVEVCGVELVEDMATEAATKLDQVVRGNIEQVELPFEKGYFDYLITADVLEHLIDPWQTLRELTDYLRPGGHLIVSIPNVQNWRIVFNLLFKGNWHYADSGLMDRTHLRFFTRKTLYMLIRQAGYSDIKIFSSFELRKQGAVTRLLNRLSLGCFRNLLTYQYIAVASL